MGKLIASDCIEALRALEAGSVDSIVTDPPAGISFMNVSWDHDKGGRDRWIEWMTEVARECLRVIKPGGHALVWALPRTSHWTAMAWENAGWEVRERIAHVFGTGFPKSASVEKMIDKAAGVEREDKFEGAFKLGRAGPTGNKKCPQCGKWLVSGSPCTCPRPQDEPITEDAKRWKGWGTALKPATEDWWLLRKPLIGTVVENVLKHATGALNIDGCRVPEVCPEKPQPILHSPTGNIHSMMCIEGRNGETSRAHPSGRWPTNLVLTHHPNCRQVGTKKVKGTRAGSGGGFKDGKYSGSAGRGEYTGTAFDGFADADGMETVPEFECVESRSVRAYVTDIGVYSPVSSQWFPPGLLPFVLGGLLAYNKACRDPWLHVSEVYHIERKRLEVSVDGLSREVCCALEWSLGVDLQFDCRSCLHLCDVLVHRILAACQCGIPSLADALVAVHSLLRGCEHSLRNRFHGLPSSSDVVVQSCESDGISLNSRSCDAQSSALHEQSSHIRDTDESAPRRSVLLDGIVDYSSGELSDSCETLFCSKDRDAAFRLVLALTCDLASAVLPVDSGIIRCIDTQVNLCPVKEMGEQSGERTSGSGEIKASAGKKVNSGWAGTGGMHRAGRVNVGIRDFGDNGSASRFFPCFKYEPKSSTAERGLGLESDRNKHPTVKPLDLMRWLVRLVTPSKGIVLDPFLGSGTTAMAAILEGKDWIGIEREAEYVEIAKARIAWAEEHVRRFGLPPLDMGTMEAVKEREEADDGDADQTTLF